MNFQRFQSELNRCREDLNRLKADRIRFERDLNALCRLVDRVLLDYSIQ